MGWRWAPVTDFMAEMISDLQKPEGIAGSAAEVTAPPLQLLREQLQAIPRLRGLVELQSSD